MLNNALCQWLSMQYILFTVWVLFYCTSCVTVLSIYTVKLGIMISNLDYHLEVKLGP